MIKMVVGFAFVSSHVLLVQKERPDWQHAKLNGVGGKVELGERSLDAMVREFKEETGLYVHSEDWLHVLMMFGCEWMLDVYTVALHKGVENLQDYTDAEEPLGFYDMERMAGYVIPTIENLNWIIPLCYYEYLRPTLKEPHPEVILYDKPPGI